MPALVASYSTLSFFRSILALLLLLDTATLNLFGDAIVGILYKQQVQGADVAAIAASVKNWLLHNLRTYGDALSALTPPPKADARN